MKPLLPILTTVLGVQPVAPASSAPTTPTTDPKAPASGFRPSTTSASEPDAKAAKTDAVALPSTFSIEIPAIDETTVADARTALGFKRDAGSGVDLNGDINLTFVTRKIGGTENALTLNRAAIKPTDPGALKTNDWTVIVAPEDTQVQIKGLRIQNSRVVALQSLSVDPDKDAADRSYLGFYTVKVDPEQEIPLLLTDDMSTVNQPILHLQHLGYLPPNEKGELWPDPKQTEFYLSMYANVGEAFAEKADTVIGWLSGGKKQPLKNSALRKMGSERVIYRDNLEKVVVEMTKSGVHIGPTKTGEDGEVVKKGVNIPGIIESGRFTLTNLDLAPMLNAQHPVSGEKPEDHDANFYLSVPPEIQARLAKEGLGFRPLAPDVVSNPVYSLKELLSRLMKSGEFSLDFNAVNIDQHDPKTGVSTVGKAILHSNSEIRSIGPDALYKALSADHELYPDLTEVPYFIAYPVKDQPNIEIPLFVMSTPLAKDATGPALQLRVSGVKAKAQVFALTSDHRALREPAAVLRDVSLTTEPIIAADTRSDLQVEYPKGLAINVDRVMFGKGPGIYADYIASYEKTGKAVPADLLAKAKFDGAASQKGHIYIPELKFRIKSKDGQILQGQLFGITLDHDFAGLDLGPDGAGLGGEFLIHKLLDDTLSKLTGDEIVRILQGIRLQTAGIAVDKGTIRFTENGKADVLVDLHPSNVSVDLSMADGKLGIHKPPTTVNAAAANVQVALPGKRYDADITVRNLNFDGEAKPGRVWVEHGEVEFNASLTEDGQKASSTTADVMLCDLMAGIDYEKQSGQFVIHPELSTKLIATVKAKQQTLYVNGEIAAVKGGAFTISGFQEMLDAGGKGDFHVDGAQDFKAPHTIIEFTAADGTLTHVTVDADLRLAVQNGSVIVHDKTITTPDGKVDLLQKLTDFINALSAGQKKVDLLAQRFQVVVNATGDSTITSPNGKQESGKLSGSGSFTLDDLAVLNNGQRASGRVTTNLDAKGSGFGLNFDRLKSYNHATFAFDAEQKSLALSDVTSNTDVLGSMQVYDPDTKKTITIYLDTNLVAMIREAKVVLAEGDSGLGMCFKMGDKTVSPNFELRDIQIPSGSFKANVVIAGQNSAQRHDITLPSFTLDEGELIATDREISGKGNFSGQNIHYALFDNATGEGQDLVGFDIESVNADVRTNNSGDSARVKASAQGVKAHAGNPENDGLALELSDAELIAVGEHLRDVVSALEKAQKGRKPGDLQLNDAKAALKPLAGSLEYTLASGERCKIRYWKKSTPQSEAQAITATILDAVKGSAKKDAGTLVFSGVHNQMRLAVDGQVGDQSVSKTIATTDVHYTFDVNNLRFNVPRAQVSVRDQAPSHFVMVDKAGKTYDIHLTNDFDAQIQSAGFQVKPGENGALTVVLRQGGGMDVDLGKQIMQLLTSGDRKAAETARYGIDFWIKDFQVVSQNTHAEITVVEKDGKKSNLSVILPHTLSLQDFAATATSLNGVAQATSPCAELHLYTPEDKTLFKLTITEAKAKAEVSADGKSDAVIAVGAGAKRIQTQSAVTLKGQSQDEQGNLYLALDNVTLTNIAEKAQNILQALREHDPAALKGLTDTFRFSAEGGKDYLVRYESVTDDGKPTNIKGVLDEQNVTLAGHMGPGAYLVIDQMPEHIGMTVSGERHGHQATGHFDLNILTDPNRKFSITYDSATGAVVTDNIPEVTLNGEAHAGDEKIKVTDFKLTKPYARNLYIRNVEDFFKNSGKGKITFSGEAGFHAAGCMEALINGQAYGVNLDFDVAAALENGSLTVEDFDRFMACAMDGFKTMSGGEMHIQKLIVQTAARVDLLVPAKDGGKAQWVRAQMPDASLEIKDLHGDANGWRGQMTAQSNGTKICLVNGQRDASGKFDTSKKLDFVELTIEEVSATSTIDSKAGGDHQLNVPSVRAKNIGITAGHKNDPWGDQQTAVDVQEVEARAVVNSLNALKNIRVENGKIIVPKELRGSYQVKVTGVNGSPDRVFNVYAKMGGKLPLELQAALSGVEVKGDIGANPDASQAPDARLRPNEIVIARMGVATDPITHDVKVGKPGDQKIYRNVLPKLNLSPDTFQVTSEGRLLANFDANVVMQTFGTTPNGDPAKGELAYDVLKDPIYDRLIPEIVGDRIANDVYKVTSWSKLTDEQKAKYARFVDLPYRYAKAVLDGAAEGRRWVNYNEPTTLNAIAYILYPSKDDSIKRFYELTPEQQTVVRSAAESSEYRFDGKDSSNTAAIVKLLKFDAKSPNVLKIARQINERVKQVVKTEPDMKATRTSFKADVVPVIHALPLAVAHADMKFIVDTSALDALKKTDPDHLEDYPDLSRLTEDSTVNLQMVLYGGPEDRQFKLGPSDTAVRKDSVNQINLWVGKVAVDPKTGDPIKDPATGQLKADPKGVPYGVLVSRYGKLRERTPNEMRLRKPGEPTWTVDWTMATNLFKVNDPPAPSGVQPEKPGEDVFMKRIIYGVSVVNGFTVISQRGREPVAFSEGNNKDGFIHIFDLVNALTFGAVPKFTTFKQESPWTDLPVTEEFADLIKVANEGLLEEMGDVLALMGANHTLTLPHRGVDGFIVFNDPKTKKEVRIRVQDGLIYDQGNKTSGQSTMSEWGYAQFLYQGKPYYWKFNMDGKADRGEMRFESKGAAKPQKKAAGAR